MSGSACGDNCSEIFWTKIGFIVFVWAEAFFSGIAPTLSTQCRESPKVLGIANSFAAGVFLAIALMHILPEQAEAWADNTVERKGPDAKIFPLAEMLTFFGYIIILILDKVLFDSSQLFERDGDHQLNDPADQKLANDVKRSMTKH